MKKNNLVPGDFFITKGSGCDEYEIHAGAIHMAMWDAGIADYNLMKYTSVLPATSLSTATEPGREAKPDRNLEVLPWPICRGAPPQWRSTAHGILTTCPFVAKNSQVSPAKGRHAAHQWWPRHCLRLLCSGHSAQATKNTWTEIAD